MYTHKGRHGEEHVTVYSRPKYTQFMIPRNQFGRKELSLHVGLRQHIQPYRIKYDHDIEDQISRYKYRSP